MDYRQGLIDLEKRRRLRARIKSLFRRPYFTQDQPFTLISIHMPKCGGISFSDVLEQLYGPSLWQNYGIIHTREQLDRSVIPSGVKCIHGHFLANVFDDVFETVKLVTWLRHPVERVASNYFYFLRNPKLSKTNAACRMLHDQKLSLVEFSGLDIFANQMTRFMAGKRLSDLDFVGITEEYDASLSAFLTEFGVERAFSAPRKNRNIKNFSSTYRLSDDERQQISEYNSADLRLYREAVEIFDVPKTGPTISRCIQL